MNRQHTVEGQIGESQSSQESQSLNSKRQVLKRLDNLPLSRWHLFMVLALGAVWIFDGYEVSLISLFRKYIVNENGDEVFKSLATAYQVGCIVGSIIFGISAFIIGRRKVFMITLSIYAVGIFFSLMNGSIPLFVLGRFLTGVSVGGEFTAIFTAIDEFLPPKYRGRVNIGIDGTWHLGGAMAAGLNLGLGEIQNWRFLFSIGLLGVLSLLVMRKNIPESPRWLILKDQHQRANTIIKSIQYAVENKKVFLQSESHFYRGQNNQNIPNSERSDKNQPSSMISSQPGFSESSQTERQRRNSITGQIMQIVAIVVDTFKKYKSRFFLALFLMFSQAFFFNLVYYKFPATLSDKYNLSQQQISLYMLPLSLCSFISTLVVGPFFDLIGRKQLLLITYCSSGVLLFATSFVQELLWLEVLTCFMFCFTSPAGSSANLIASEIFPTSSRTIILFLMFNVGMVGGIGGVWLNAIWIGSLLMLMAGVLGFLICPKSENKSLEQIESIK